MKTIKYIATALVILYSGTTSAQTANDILNLLIHKGAIKQNDNAKKIIDGSLLAKDYDLVHRIRLHYSFK